MKRGVSFFAALNLLLTTPLCAGADSLSLFCALGDTAALRDALSDGADPNAPDEHGRTPLYHTVSAGVDAPLSMHLEAIRLLANFGADVDAPSPDGDTPLLFSLRKGAAFTEVTALLLEFGADPNRLAQGERPLNAASRDPASARQLELLLEHGADIHLKDETGHSPLVTAVTSPDPSAKKIRLLLDAGANVNEAFRFQDEEGLTPLMAAAALSSPDVIRLLLDRGALSALSSRSGLHARDYAQNAGRQDNAALLP